jgi:hypothetical protein
MNGKKMKAKIISEILSGETSVSSIAPVYSLDAVWYQLLTDASCAAAMLRISRLVIVWIRRYCFVVQEIARILCCTHTLEGPGCLVQTEEAS